MICVDNEYIMNNYGPFIKETKWKSMSNGCYQRKELDSVCEHKDCHWIQSKILYINLFLKKKGRRKRKKKKKEDALNKCFCLLFVLCTSSFKYQGYCFLSPIFMENSHSSSCKAVKIWKHNIKLPRFLYH